MSKESNKILDEAVELLIAEKFSFESDYNVNYNRVIVLKRYGVSITLYQNANEISYDVYADLAKGIYEIGDMNILTNHMLRANRIAKSFNFREMNTPERLYPSDRAGVKCI